MRRGMPRIPGMCMKSKVRWKPMTKSQKCHLPSVSLVHPARELREPVIEAAEEREEDGAHDDIVKVRDDEVRIAQLPIERRGSQHDPGEPGNQELEQESRCRTASASRSWILPPHMVASQLKILIPVGTAIAMVESTKNAFAYEAHADREHVMRPDAHG